MPRTPLWYHEYAPLFHPLDSPDSWTVPATLVKPAWAATRSAQSAILPQPPAALNHSSEILRRVLRWDTG
jgi:hypothetical protein